MTAFREAVFNDTLRAQAHNALAAVARGMALPLTDRLRISRAVLNAVEPLIRQHERARFVSAAKDFPEPFRGIIAKVAADDSAI